MMTGALKDANERQDSPPTSDKFVLSLSGGPASMRLEFPMPLTDAMWNQLTGMLAAMKPTLVQAGPGTPAAPAHTVSPTSQDDAPSSSLTAEAQELLKKVDAGGVPAFTTDNLQRIATEHGVSVSPDMTPNEVIEELRQRSLPERARG